MKDDKSRDNEVDNEMAGDNKTDDDESEEGVRYDNDEPVDEPEENLGIREELRITLLLSISIAVSAMTHTNQEKPAAPV